VAQRTLGLDADAPVPPFAAQRFDRWFRRRGSTAGNGRSRVILWDDTWVRYHEPSVGRAAVVVLEAAGLEVALAEDRVCCGRPAASRGLLDELRRAATHNLAVLRNTRDPIIFLEPSCWSVFVDEYRQLGIEGADEVAERCVLFEEFVAELLEGGTLDSSLMKPAGAVAVHGHCHAKALADQKTPLSVLEHLPGVTPRLLETGCCGMAGAFGMLSEHRELSHQVARPLVEAIESLPSKAAVVASGTSCRHQIADLTDVRPLHLAEFLASCLQRQGQ
jgi:Fe-S oxidoreductase